MAYTTRIVQWYTFTHERAFQIYTRRPWHYAAGKEMYNIRSKNKVSDDQNTLLKVRPVCKSKDMYCFFLRFSPCNDSRAAAEERPSMRNFDKNEFS